MADFIDMIKKRVRNDWDAMIVITGEHGVGKSTCMQILGFGLDENFDQEKNISYIPTARNITEKFNGLNQYQVMGIDEAMEVMFKQDFMKDFQKTLIKMYARERKQNKITIMCIPSFADLNKSFRNNRVKYWIYIVERGHGIIMCRPQTPYSEDAWNLKSLDKDFFLLLERKRATNLMPDDIVDSLKKTPYFIDEFYFEDLPNDKKEIYQRCVKEQRDIFYATEENELEKKPIRVTGLLIEYLHDECGLTFTEIAQIAKNENTISWIARLYKMIKKLEGDIW